MNRGLYFWKNLYSKPDTWPVTASKLIYISEALELAGSAMFGAEWDKAPRTAQKSWEKPSKTPPPLIASPEGDIGDVPMLDQEPGKIQARADLYFRIWEANEKAIVRITTVTKWIQRHGIDGAFQTYALNAKPGSEPFPIKGSFWTEQNLFDIFNQGGLPNRQSGNGHTHIFLDRESFTRTVGLLEYAPLQLSDHDLSRLPPYLNYAVRLALANDYLVGGKAESSVVREAVVNDYWAANLPEDIKTKAALENIAWILGIPNPVAIKQGKSARGRKAK